MEISTNFETYIILDDDEFKCQINAEGTVTNNSFWTEFGNEVKYSIDNVVITRIYNTETDEDISFVSLKNKQRKILLRLAEDYLEEKESNYVEEA